MTCSTRRTRCSRHLVAWLAAAAPPLFAAEPAAQPLPAGIEACAQIRLDAERLACYDKFAAPRVKGSLEAPVVEGGMNTKTAVPPDSAASAAVANASRRNATLDDKGQFLDQYWELGQDRKRGTFNFDGYRPNYFFPVHYTSRTNQHPNSPAPDHAGTLPDYRDVEAKLQISLRTKVLEDFGLPGGDVWFGYTEQSLWQLYSGGISRPFRSTDHEPEAFYIVPTPVDLPLGFKLKMVGLGIAHQSNGQSDPFSRSWNRWYALGGIENGDFALTARYNTRIHESDGQDDNPDLTSYRGKTELLGLWTPGLYTLSALWKTNFTSRGSVQLDATMPVSRKDPKGLRWYLQAFTGYGETLIDYNFRQTSVSAGVSLLGW